MISISPSSSTLRLFLRWWNVLRLNFEKFCGSWISMMSFRRNGSSVRRSFQFFVLMFNSSTAWNKYNINANECHPMQEMSFYSILHKYSEYNHSSFLEIWTISNEINFFCKHSRKKLIHVYQLFWVLRVFIPNVPMHKWNLAINLVHTFESSFDNNQHLYLKVFCRMFTS